MEYQFIHPVMLENITPEQIQHNIDVAIKDIDTRRPSLDKSPTYKTLRQFSIDEVFILFGLKKTALYRLTQSDNARFLPRVIVIYCNTRKNENEEAPVIIDDKLFISHSYFKQWISSTSNEIYEAELLNLIMRKMEFTVSHSH